MSISITIIDSDTKSNAHCDWIILIDYWKNSIIDNNNLSSLFASSSSSSTTVSITYLLSLIHNISISNFMIISL